MDVFVVTKVYFTGADTYSNVIGVCATEAVAEKIVVDVMSASYYPCVNCNIAKHSLIGF